MLENMKNKTPITDTSEGSIGRGFLEIFNSRIEDSLDYVDDTFIMAYVSRAIGSSLDLVGELVDCDRKVNESDDNYRYRITKQVHIAAKSNREAIKAKCLEVEGVKDVYLTRYTHGIGSFTVHVVSDEFDTPDSLVNQVQAVIDENQAEGVKGVAAKPKLVPIDIVIRAVPVSGVSKEESSSIAYDIKSKIDEYIKQLNMGQPINSMDVYRIAKNSRIAETSIESLKVNSREVSKSLSQYNVRWDEKCYPRQLEIIT